MAKRIESGMKFYDDKNGRYLTAYRRGADPKVWACDVEELNEEGEYELVDTCALFTESELKKMEVVA